MDEWHLEKPPTLGQGNRASGESRRTSVGSRPPLRDEAAAAAVVAPLEVPDLRLQLKDAALRGVQLVVQRRAQAPVTHRGGVGIEIGGIRQP